jgi:pseudaminic acid biosynthesis-associated methylase
MQIVLLLSDVDGYMTNDEDPVEVWKSTFGQGWTDRSPDKPEAVDEERAELYGVTRTELNKEFLADIPTCADILDVGTNIGIQLAILSEMGYRNLYGVDILPYALEKAREKWPSFRMVAGDAGRLPFEDDAFDVVCTTGLLIHIPPEEIGETLQELKRVSAEWIWGREYYAEEYQEVNYRGHDILWKADFASLYERHCDLKVVHERLLPYQDNSGNVDKMFLLRATD